jgi:hypothetical protein
VLLPDLAVNGGLCVDLVLVHVELAIENLFYRLDLARVLEYREVHFDPTQTH